MDDDEFIIAAAASACAMVAADRIKKRKKRTMWVNPYLEERRAKGRYVTAVYNDCARIQLPE